MESADKLGKYLKELPREEPSDHFTRMVMDRVMAEAKYSPATYHPLISSRSWIVFGIGFLLLIFAAAVLQSYFPGGDHPTGWISLFSLDYSGAWKPFLTFSETMKKIPVTYFGALAAILLLVTADRLFSFNSHK